MKRIWPGQSVDLLQQYGKYSAMGVLVLGGLALKPALMTNARSPEVMAGEVAANVQATALARSRQRQEQTRQIRPENYDLSRFPVSNSTEKHWRNILWTTTVVEPADPFVVDALDQILGMMVLPGLSTAQMRTVDMATKVGIQLYLRKPAQYSQLGQRFLQAIEQSSDPEWVAVSLSGLAKSGMPLEQLQPLAERIKARFPNWTKNVYLYTTVREIAEQLSPRPVPPLSDLLNWEIAPRQLHLYVICQPDRDVLCLTALKDRDGNFVRQRDGQLWSLPLLLRSIHGLGWNFVRGQTPQGIYRIEGIVPQPDDEFFRAYGKFSLVNLYVPFEAGAKQFLPGKPGPFKGNLLDYQNLLPASWRNYWAIQQSYWAGKAGRSEFRIHGTGEAPDFFSNKGNNSETYNWNPTIGCLSALEIYNDNGQLIDGHMPALLGALRTVGGKNFAGYMVVVEVPGKPGQAIALETIDAAIRQGKGAVVPGNKLRTQKPKTDVELGLLPPGIAVETAAIPKTSDGLKSVPVEALAAIAPAQPSPTQAPKTQSQPSPQPISQPSKQVPLPPLAY